jgi:hypothetical protein
LAEAHPPGITEPEERGAIGMFKVLPIPGDANRAMPVQRVLTRIGFDTKRPGTVM